MKYLKDYKTYEGLFGVNESYFDLIPHDVVMDVQDIVYDLNDLGVKCEVTALDRFWVIRKIGQTDKPDDRYEWIKITISDAYEAPLRDLVEVIKRLDDALGGRRMNLFIEDTSSSRGKSKTIHINHSQDEEFDFNSLTDVIVDYFGGNFDSMVISISKSND